MSSLRILGSIQNKPLSEFGVKAPFAVSDRTGLVLGARSYPGDPYDGHTLVNQLEQTETLTGIKPRRCYVDRGYRGNGSE